MVWKSRHFIFLFLSFLISYKLHCYQIIPFIPKDKASNLLFQSSDDQVRYLLQNQNTLSLVEVAKSTQLHRASVETAQYEVVSSTAKRHILVTLDETPFTNFDPNKNKKLFWGTYKGPNLNPLGDGLLPQLHLDDQWASFFDASKKTLNFESLQMLGKNSYKLTLNNKFSPYFVPEVSMIEHEQVLYTDLNEKGEEALITYNLRTKAFAFIHKTVGAGKKISHCSIGKDVLIAEFDLNTNAQLAIYSMTYRDNKTFSEKTTYYTDNSKYQPKILCRQKEKSVFLLKSTSSLEKQKFSNQSILVNISIPKVNILEIPFDRSFAQIFTMDDRILLQSSGRIYQVAK